MQNFREEKYPVAEEMRDAFVVDVDFHFEPSLERILPYCTNSAVKRNVELKSPPTPEDWYSAYATPFGGSGKQAHGVAETAEDVEAVMETLAIDQPLLVPGYNEFPGQRNVVMKNEMTRMYNDYVLDEVGDIDGDARVLPMLPQWDPETAVAEIERVADDRSIAGFYGFHGHFDLLGNPEYDEIFATLVERDLPLALHGGGTGAWTQKDPIGGSLRTWTEMYGIVHPVRAMMMVGNMIVTGVFDKYPDLRVAILEGGVNWVPFLAYRLDEVYNEHPEDIQLTERMTEMGREYLEKQPSEYIFDHFTFSTQPIAQPPRTKHAEAMLEMVHADETLMYASDFPHFTLDLHNWVFESPVIDEELREGILHENAERVFRL